MTPTQYETTLVIDAHLSNEQIESTVEKYSKLISDNDGKILLMDRWGKRRLAYEIKKKQYGFYVYVRFEASGTIVKLMEREIKLDDSIIRHLTVIVPKKVVSSEELEPVKTEEAVPATPAVEQKTAEAAPATEASETDEEKTEEA